MRVDWPAQPYLTLAQTISTCFVYWNRPNHLAHRTANQILLSSGPRRRNLSTAPKSANNPTPSSKWAGRRTEWRASNVKWKDDTHPPANIFPTIIFLIY